MLSRAANRGSLRASKKGLINKNAVVSYSKTYEEAAARADELSREEGA